MKTNLFLIALFIYSFGFAQYTAIPDTNFENALSAYDDIPNDGQVPTANINTVTILNVISQNIFDLTGIEGFTALTNLNCANNQLSSLNITNNSFLENLSCSENHLTNLDVSQNLSLIYLHCTWNQLTTLDLSVNSNLEYLICAENQLTNINVSAANSALIDLHCSNNQLANLNLSSNLALNTLHCSNNQLTSLDLSNNTSFLSLNCNNNQLNFLDLRNGNNSNFNNYNYYFSTANNPNLTCIFVDDAAWSTTAWSFYIDSTSTFVETQLECDNITDADGDGFTITTGDCDDNNATIFPGATEICDGYDNNCDGNVDEGVTTTYYYDADGDGYGSNDTSLDIQVCSGSEPATYISISGDCDDSDPSINPGATDIPNNGIDEDCSGQDATASIEDELFNKNLSIYPNPTENKITIKIDRLSNYKIFNIGGQLIKKGNLLIGENTLDVFNFSNGVYFIKINSNSNNATLKLVKK